MGHGDTEEIEQCSTALITATCGSNAVALLMLCSFTGGKAIYQQERSVPRYAQPEEVRSHPRSRVR